MCQNYAKCELMKIREDKVKIAIAEKEYSRLKEFAESMTSPPSGNGGGGGQHGDRLGSAVPAYVDAERLLASLKKEAEAHRKKWYSLIHRLRKIVYTDILYERFFEMKKVSVIAKAKNYSERRINDFIKEALDELNEILKGEIEDEPD